MHPCVQSSIIYNSQDMGTTQMPIDRGMDKEDMVRIYNGILLSLNKEWNTAICCNIDGPRNNPTQWRKSDRERQMSCDVTNRWNLKIVHDAALLYQAMRSGSSPFHLGWGGPWGLANQVIKGDTASVQSSRDTHHEKAGTSLWGSPAATWKVQM